MRDKLLLSLGPEQEDHPKLQRHLLHVHLGWKLELELNQLLPWRLGKQLRDKLLLSYRLDKENCSKLQRHVLHVCRGS